MWQQGPSAAFDELDVTTLRERLRTMSDDQLVKFGKAAAYMCSPKANLGHAPRKEFVVQLDEARSEWRRRHPKSVEGNLC
ncbi:MAG TPA: hypothetical protein VEI49_00490 [Terriglobales bacterium]|nr:hypothetical protein [Terriglobales bacterium]